MQRIHLDGNWTDNRLENMPDSPSLLWEETSMYRFIRHVLLQL